MKSEESLEKKGAQLALQPSVNSAVVIQAYSETTFGKQPDINTLIGGLRDSIGTVQSGDLSSLEAMLIGQAAALQSIFTSLAKRSLAQNSQRNLEALLGLALKAQAQSRATVQAVADLKCPRQVAFVKQANFSHGAQQVNNGTLPKLNTRTKKNQAQQNKLLEDQCHGRTYLDIGTTTTPSRINQALETMGTVDRTKQR